MEIIIINRILMEIGLTSLIELVVFMVFLVAGMNLRLSVNITVLEEKR